MAVDTLSLVPTTETFDAAKYPAKLRIFAKDWTTQERALHVLDLHETTTPWMREVLRSDMRLIVHTFARGLDHLPVECFTFSDEAAARLAFEELRSQPPAGYKAYDPYYVPGKRGGTWIRILGDDRGYACGDAFVWNDRTIALEGDPRAAIDAAESTLMRAGEMCSYLDLDPETRPDDDILLGAWMEDRERNDTEGAVWHLEGLLAIHRALMVAEVSGKEVEVVLEAPATASELAAYDQTLPTPMPDVLRELWLHAGGATWRVGKVRGTLLSPSEAVAQKSAHRAELATRIAALKKSSQPAQWAAMTLDAIVVQDGETQIALDVDQREIEPHVVARGEVFYGTGAPDLTTKTQWIFPTSLAHALAECFISNFVDAIRAKYPAVKKTKYGEPLRRK